VFFVFISFINSHKIDLKEEQLLLLNIRMYIVIVLYFNIYLFLFCPKVLNVWFFVVRQCSPDDALSLSLKPHTVVGVLQDNLNDGVNKILFCF
jgi:hypothetical protein